MQEKKKKKPVKKENVKKNNNKKQSTKHKNKSMKGKIAFLTALIVVDLVAVVCYFLYGKDIIRMQTEAKEVVSTSTIDTFRQSETSIVYDSNNNVLTTLKGEKDVYYIDNSEIPDYVKYAMIAIEDKKFYKHKGIDVKANIRALTALIRNKGEIKQGASTITQQLSRNVFLSQEVTFTRKFKEIFVALELEKKYSKDQILEFYLNNIYFANGYYGIQAASEGYFSKSVSELSLSQIAFLCAIPNNPTLYDPDQNINNTLKRRDRILNQMYQDGYINLADSKTAKTEKITLKRKKTNKKNFIETYVYHSATEALMKSQGFNFRNAFENNKDRKEYDESYNEAYNQCRQSLYTGGYRIYTSIDQKKQKILQKAINTQLKDFTEKDKEGIYKLQGAATCIDNATGRVVAIVGGRYQNTVGYTLNRAYQSFRQPGSSIKPLIVYTPSFERNYTLDSIVVDSPIKDGPSNSDGSYDGKMTVKTAIEKSKNTIAWKLYSELTPQIGLQYLLEMNFKKIVNNDYYNASALGGLTNGVNTVEMASGYAAIENDGLYRNPTCIIKITDSEDNLIVKESSDEKEIYKKNAARMMINALVGVVEHGTGYGLKIPNMSTAGKTGTTNDKKDGWFVGFTPYYTTSVWVGYDIPKTLSNLSGATYPGHIWYDFMSQIHQALQNKEFAGYLNNNVTNKVNEKDQDNVGDQSDIETTTEPTINPDNNAITDNKNNGLGNQKNKDKNNNSKKDQLKDDEVILDDGTNQDVNDDSNSDNTSGGATDTPSNDQDNTSDNQGTDDGSYEEDTNVYPDDQPTTDDTVDKTQ